jgi:squalene-associated FAD-dependent desaturase
MPEQIVIIGGGFAGLTAGVALANAGRQVRVLEQRRFLGGRARSFPDPATGTVVDNGQHVIMGCYHSTLRFLREIGTVERICFQPRLHVDFADINGRLTTLDCPNLPAPWHLVAGVLRTNSLTAAQKLEIIRLGLAFRGRGNGVDQLAHTSLEEWLVRLGQSESLRRRFWDLLSISAMNEDPRIASALLFRRVLRLALFSSASESRIGLARGGWSECYTDAARAYIVARGGMVETGCSVSEVLVARGDDQCCGVRLANGEVIEARTVVSTVPCFQFLSLLPESLAVTPWFGRISTLRPSPIVCTYLWLDRDVTDCDFIALRGTTAQWLFRRSTAARAPARTDFDSRHCVCMVISGAHAQVTQSTQDLARLAFIELESVLPGARSAKLLHSLVIKERFATFSPTCDAETARPSACTPVRGLYLAGDWTDTGLPATIEGAVKSGYTAVEAIIHSNLEATAS